VVVFLGCCGRFVRWSCRYIYWRRSWLGGSLVGVMEGVVGVIGMTYD